jgi:hypothetical protein
LANHINSNPWQKIAKALLNWNKWSGNTKKCYFGSYSENSLVQDFLRKNMKKGFILSALVAMPTLFWAAPSVAAVYIKYSNKDSKEHVMKASMDGVTKEVTFEGNTTGAATIQGSGKAAVIETSCGKVEVKDEAKIEIKNGCIKVQ